MTEKDIITDLRPPDSAVPIARKLGAMTLLSDEELTFLEGLHGNTATIAPETDFIEDGEAFKATFIVVSGWAIRYVLTPSGRRQILSYALPGDILGLHVNFRRMSSYSAAALTQLELAVVEPLRINEISQKYPVLAAGLSWCTAREYAILGDQTVRLGRLDAGKRLIHLLLELWHRLRLVGETKGDWFEFPMTQNDLADTLGLSLVHINRQMQKLKKLGLITMDNGWVQLIDIPKLIEYAEFNPEHLQEFKI